MRRPLLLLIAASLAALAVVPSVSAATADDVTTVELSRVGDRTLAPLGAVSRFTLAGVRWRGSGNVVFRTRVDRRPLEPVACGSARGRGRARPALAGVARERLAGRQSVVGRRVGPHPGSSDGNRHEGPSPPRLEPADAHPAKGTDGHGDAADRAEVVVGCGREDPARPAELREPTSVFAIVHHTAGRNGYTRAEAAAIVKGIQLFHVQGNGWNDIGYNFLVDRFGTIYEGRFGGVESNVVGAHAQGFNTGSVGIALLGTYENSPPSAAAQDAIARLIAWRLDLAHVDPTSFLTFVSGGSDRFPTSIPVLLSAISGHRDTGYTACPGRRPLRPARRDRLVGSGHRRPQDLRAEGDGRRVGGSCSRPALAGPELGRRRHRDGRRRARSWHRDGNDRRLDVGVRGHTRRVVPMDDLGRSVHGRPPARCVPEAAYRLSRSRPSPPSRRRSPRTETVRPT